MGLHLRWKWKIYPCVSFSPSLFLFLPVSLMWEFWPRGNHHHDQHVCVDTALFLLTDIGSLSGTSAERLSSHLIALSLCFSENVSLCRASSETIRILSHLFGGFDNVCVFEIHCDQLVLLSFNQRSNITCVFWAYHKLSYVMITYHKLWSVIKE